MVLQFHRLAASGQEAPRSPQVRWLAGAGGGRSYNARRARKSLICIIFYRPSCGRLSLAVQRLQFTVEIEVGRLLVF